MSQNIEKTKEKIESFIKDIHDCYSGKIKEIIISKTKLSEEEFVELRESLGYLCSTTDLGFFAFMIEYTVDDGHRYLLGLPIDFGFKR